MAGARLMQLNRALYGLLHPWTNPSGREHRVGGGRYDVAYLEPFNPSRKMTRWGRHVQCDRHRVIANDLPPPESQLHTHTHTHPNEVLVE